MPIKKTSNLNKKIFVIVIILIAITIILIVVWVNKAHDNDYKIEIHRIFSSSSEGEAIYEAEELDLAIILNVSRYYNHRGTNDPPADITAYIWPILVDKETLNYYTNKIERLEEDHVSVRASFYYNAEGLEFSETSISYDNLSLICRINETVYQIDISEDPNYDTYSNCAIFINNSLEVITSETQSIQMNVSKGYIVKQVFDYSEVYGPLAGFGGGVEQIIVLAQDYSPLLVLSRPTSGWIS